MPTRAELLVALGEIQAKVTAKCKGSGSATAAIQIAGRTGKATSVSVRGVDGTDAACIEDAVRSTAFPKFERETFDVLFPFKLGGPKTRG